MADRPADERAQPERRARSASEPSPDELEQRQRADGTLEETGVVDDTSGEPLDADQIEQRQRADGSFEVPGRGDEDTEEPLTPDMIDQRRVVSDDDDLEEPSEAPEE